MIQLFALLIITFALYRIRSIYFGSLSPILLGLYCGFLVFYSVGGVLGAAGLLPFDYYLGYEIYEYQSSGILILFAFILNIEISYFFSRIIYGKSLEVRKDLRGAIFFNATRRDNLILQVFLFLSLFLFIFFRYGGLDGVLSRLYFGRSSTFELSFSYGNLSDGSLVRLLLPILESIFLLSAFALILRYNTSSLMSYCLIVGLVGLSILSGVRSDLLYPLMAYILLKTKNDGVLRIKNLVYMSLIVLSLVVLVYTIRINSNTGAVPLAAALFGIDFFGDLLFILKNIESYQENPISFMPLKLLSDVLPRSIFPFKMDDFATIQHSYNVWGVDINEVGGNRLPGIIGFHLINYGFYLNHFALFMGLFVFFILENFCLNRLHKNLRGLFLIFSFFLGFFIVRNPDGSFLFPILIIVVYGFFLRRFRLR